MTLDHLPAEVLDGLIVARGSSAAVQNARFLNTLRAFLRAFEPSADASPFVPVSGTGGSAGPVVLVACDGGLVHRVSLWAVACDFVREHAGEYELDVVDDACKRLRDVLVQ